MPYKNKDGLWIKFPADGRDTRGGEFAVPGTPERVALAHLDLVALNGSTDAPLDPGITGIPANVVITGVDVVTTTAAAGGTSFTLGGRKFSDATDDADGFVTAAGGGLLANLTLGSKQQFVKGTANAGAYIGTKFATAKDLSVTVTGTFTAGVVDVWIKYIVPGADATTSNFD